jgi:hypothetical protein
MKLDQYIKEVKEIYPKSEIIIDEWNGEIIIHTGLIALKDGEITNNPFLNIPKPE